MNAVTNAARSLSLVILFAITALTGGCAVGTDSTDEPDVDDVTEVTEGEDEAVGEAQDEIKGVVAPQCGYCYYWLSSENRCVRSELNACAIPGNG
ncbi:MAG: hypothetical protein IPK82_03695 [Polyangiaceae bacterium]|nr:hypothetical protein [Polyangiaceae bacterium]